MNSYQPRDPAVVSRNMAAIRRRDNKAERIILKQLTSRGHGYRRYHRIVGTPDIAFRRAKVAVFVDGDYWHGRVLVEHGLEGLRATFKTERREWWVAKIVANISRDRVADAALAQLGWRVVRLWEHDVIADPIGSTDRVCQAIHPSSDCGRDLRTHSGSSSPILDQRVANT